MEDARHLPPEPEDLERINQVREFLVKGNADEDQISEVNDWEKRAKDALIFLNLQKHEGITQIVTHALEEQALIKQILVSQRPKKLTVDGALAFANETELLHERLKLWSWFIDLFQLAKDDLNAIREEVALNLEDHVPEEEVPEEEE